MAVVRRAPEQMACRKPIEQEQRSDKEAGGHDWEQRLQGRLVLSFSPKNNRTMPQFEFQQTANVRVCVRVSSPQTCFFVNKVRDKPSGGVLKGSPS